MNRTIHPHELEDQHTINSATYRGRPLPCYDDGYGPLFIHRDSMGISGLVRAQTWEDAYGICEDEFFTAADEEAGEEYERIQAMPEGEERTHAENCHDEAYGYRSNTRREKDGTLSSVYAKDLNGDTLDKLSRTLAAELEIMLEIDDNEPEREPDRWHIWHLQRRPTGKGRAFLALWSGRYGASGGITARYRGNIARMTRHDPYSPTHEDPTRPEHNPEA